MLHPLDPEGRQVLEEGTDMGRGKRTDVDARLERRGDDLVLDVGEVHRLRDPVAEESERPPQHILEHERAQVPDVNPVVDGRAAGIEPDVTRLERLEFLQPSPERVVELHRFHQATPCRVEPGWRESRHTRPTRRGRWRPRGWHRRQ